MTDRPLTGSEHTALMSLLDHILGVIRGHARLGDGWIERERYLVATAANEWATAHGWDGRCTVEDVERLEVRAVGHIDYATKLALYVAEFVFLASPRPVLSDQETP